MNMTISLKVQGKEELNVTVEYVNTTKETVVLVENALIHLLAELNKK